MAYLIQILSLLSLLFYIVSGQDTSPNYNYSDTKAWANIYPLCGGERQSPINFDLSSVRSTKPSICPAIDFTSYGNEPAKLSLLNTGHTARVQGNWPNGQNPDANVNIDGFMGSYRFTHFNLHWSKNDANGTEHRFNGNGLALELQAVHLNNKYSTNQDAVAADDGTFIYSRMFYSNNRPGDLSELIPALGNIQMVGSETDLPNVSLFKLGLNCPQKFLAYKGSLTSPPCRPNVNYALCAVPGSVSKNLMSALRKIQLYNGDTNNVRPVQDSENRPVYLYQCQAS